MARPRKPRLLVSKFKGTCGSCGVRYTPGDSIVWTERGAPVYHESCWQGETPVPPRNASDVNVIDDALVEAAEHAATVAAAPIITATPVAGVAGEFAAVIGKLLASAMDPAAVKALAREVAEQICTERLRDISAPITVRVEAPLGTVEAQAGEIQHPSYERLARYLASGTVQRLWITGEAGVGKTHACEQICEALGLPYYLVTPVADKYELFGYMDANGNYIPTQLYRWATDANPRAVLIIDEIDGCMPAALVAANSALANGHAVFPCGQVALARTKVVICTANTWGQGATIEYSARMAQDGALRDRFCFLHWGLHEPTERAIALKMHPYASTAKACDASVKIRRNLEDNGIELKWGPRRTYFMAGCIAAGDSLREAALAAGLCSLDEHAQDRALEGVK